MVVDPCHVLSERNYQRVLDANDYSASDSKDAILISSDEGLPIRFAPTHGGDGHWLDNGGHDFVVDSGMLGLVPPSLCVLDAAKVHFLGDGTLVNTHEGKDIPLGFKFSLIGEPIFKAEGGVFKVSDDTGRVIIIDTSSDQ